MMWQMVLGNVVISGLEILFTIFLLQNEKVYKKHTPWILFFLMLTTGVGMTWYDLTIPIKIAVQILLIIGVGSFIYDCSAFKLLLYAILTLFAMLASEGITIGIWNTFNPPLANENIIYKDFVFPLFLAAKALNFLFVLIFKKFTSKNKEDRTFKEIMPILCISVPFFLVILCCNWVLSNSSTKTGHLLYVVCCIAVFSAFIFTLFFLEKYLTVQKKAQQEEIALQEMKMKYGYYIRRQADEEKIRSIYHDLKNHLLLLQDETVAKQLASKIESYESYINTGNEFLDIVISEKIQMARESDIRTECDIDFRQGDFVDPLDISTIFGNLMDNAIEATMNIDDSNKYIFVDVQVKERLLIIVIKNSMIGTYNPDSQTSKTNSSFHGYGLVNVRKSVKKYNGEYSINSHANEFMISVVLPIPSDL